MPLLTHGHGLPHANASVRIIQNPDLSSQITNSSIAQAPNPNPHPRYPRATVLRAKRAEMAMAGLWPCCYYMLHGENEKKNEQNQREKERRCACVAVAVAT